MLIPTINFLRDIVSLICYEGNRPSFQFLPRFYFLAPLYKAEALAIRQKNNNFFF